MPPLAPTLRSRLLSPWALIRATAKTTRLLPCLPLPLCYVRDRGSVLNWFFSPCCLIIYNSAKRWGTHVLHRTIIELLKLFLRGHPLSGEKGLKQFHNCLPI